MKKISLTLAALTLAASAFAQAQTQAQPATAAAASAPAAPQAAARHEARVEQRIAYLHRQLKITAAEEPQWKTFADTMRENGDTMGRLYRERMENRQSNALDDMKQYADLAQAHADGAKKLAEAFAPLYDSFPAGQKALADTTFRNWHSGVEQHHGRAKGKAAPGAAASAPAKP
jgi:hypothetical protein